MKIFKSVILLIVMISFISVAQDKLDKLPKIKGGISALAKNIKYPESAKKEGIMGKVVVKVIINENGNVVGTEILKGINDELDKAAVQAINKTKFEPGIMEGKKVKAEVTIPISFKLDDC